VCSGGSNPGAQCLDDGDCTGGGTCGTSSHQSVSGGQGNEASGGYHSVVGDAGKVFVDSTSVH
jgi:hypothetical protein